MHVPNSARTDSFADKLALLADTHAAGNRDVAMSLAESIKDTLGFERRLVISKTAPTVPADQWPVGYELPAAWRGWAADASRLASVSA